MKCPSSVFVCHSIKFYQSYWLWSCTKWVFSGWSKYSIETIISVIFLCWSDKPRSDQVVLPHGSAVFAGRRWAQWGNHTWKPCLALITRTRLDWQSWVCVLGPPPALLHLHPAVPELALKRPWNCILTLQYFGQTQGIYFSGKGLSQYFLQ